jgi:hypothetical protein
MIKDKKDLNIIQKVMKHRINWELSNNKMFLNFKWKYSKKKIPYSKMNWNEAISQDKLMLVNLFEYHQEISDKRRMFVNMLKYCNVY